MIIKSINDMSSEHPVGHWRTDTKGLPVFNFTGKIPYRLRAVDGKQIGFPDDPFFLLGNYAITAMVHTSGEYDIYTMQRGWARPNAPKDGFPVNGAEIKLGEKTHVLTGVDKKLAQQTEKNFGTGFAVFQMQVGELGVKRTIALLPSREINEGIPAFLVTVEIENHGKETQELTYTEKLLANQEMVGVSIEKLAYRAEVTKDNGLKVDFEPLPARGVKVVDKEEASHYDFYPASLFLQAEGEATYTSMDVDDSAMLLASKELALKAGEKQTLQFIVGSLFEQHDQQEIVKTLLTAATSDTAFRKAWKNRLPAFTEEKDEVKRRELLWNAYVLEAQAKYTAYFGETYIPQGMNYDYGYDNSSAIRDHLHYAMPVSFYNQSLSKSILRFVMKSMLHSGEIKYGVRGYGYCHPSAWIPSDFQLHVFWSVGEYLKNTGDFSFLLEETPFYPKKSGFTASVLEKLQVAFQYLNEEVGVGPHGLVRMLNADWNDQVWEHESMTWYYGTAESHYNSAMAIVVLKELIQQLEKAQLEASLARHKEILIDLINQIKTYRKGQLNAFIKDLGERDFARRAYYKPGKAMGEDEMYLEPQVFALMIPEIPFQHRLRIAKAVEDKLMNNELLGARLSEQAAESERFGKGARENAAIWYHGQGVLSLGLLSIDKEMAEKVHELMSFDNHAKQYPQYYPGQWTATDCVNSSLSPYPGLSDEPDEEWITFPAYNMHIHAWPVLFHFKKAELEISNK